MSLHSSLYDELLTYAMELFPYASPNRAQHRIIQQILALDDYEQLFLESPTGSGKSIASLTSLLTRMSMAPEGDEKIIIFTRTVSQMEPILREWGRIYSYEDVVSDTAPLILPMLGKARLCKQLPILKKHAVELEVHSQSVHVLCKSLPCDLHPDNDEDDRYQIKSGKLKLQKINMKITGAAKKRSPPIDDIINNLLIQPFCGYYGLRTMTRFANIVVATYPYLRPPLFKILLNSMGTDITKVHILIDEAHNLVQSSETVLSKDDILKTRAAFGSFPILDKLLGVMRYNKQMSASQIGKDYEFQQLVDTLSEADPMTRKKIGINLGMVVQPAVVNTAQFLRARNNGMIYTSSDQLKIIQPTPIHYLKDVAEAKTLVFQSGTFTPLDTYKRLYGFQKSKDIIIEPMRDHHRFLSFLTWKGMTSKYNRRGKTLYSNMAQTIMYLSAISPRHILVVCPSYDFLEDLLPYIENANIQSQEFDFIIEAEHDGLDIQQLANRVARNKSNMILVGVAGGKISEGVEFVKNGKSLLSTVVFAGLPFRPVTRENLFIRNIIASVAANQEVAKKLEQQIPIIRLVRQAFGRCIRSDNDKGALIILDFRAERLLKRELSLVHYKQIKPLLGDIFNFFQGYEKLDQV